MTPIYTASPWQNRFHALRVNEALGAGSVGPGKTETLIHDPVPRIWREHLRCEGKLPQFPLKWGRSVGWALHLRRTFPMLEQTITRSKRVYPEIDPGAHWDTQRHTWTFSSGYKLQFGHCQNNDDWMQYQSGEYDWIGFDELTQFEREQYNQINARLRSSDPLLMHECYTRAMSNPSTRRDGNFNLQLKDPTWVRKRFVDPCRDGNKVIKHKLVRGDGTIEYKTRIYLPASLYDNPNKAFVRQYELQLLDLPPHLLQAYLHGNWYAQVGGFYSDAWDENEHVCRPFQIPDHWKRFRSLDWGYKQPGCCLWWAMDDEGTLYCEREYTFQGQEVPQVAKRIMEIEKDLGLWYKGRSLITGPADTQLWEKRGDAVRTKVAEFAAAGIPWVQADKSPGSRSRAAQLFMGRLKAHQNHTTRAGVIFFETCVMCRNTIPGIMSDKDDWETPLDGGEDHWHDGCMYATSFASHGKKGLPTVKRYEREEGDDDDEPRRPRPVNLYKRAYGPGAN